MPGWTPKERAMVAATAMILAAAVGAGVMYRVRVNRWETIKEASDRQIEESMVVEEKLEPDKKPGVDGKRFGDGLVICGTAWGRWNVYICKPGELIRLESENGTGWYAWRQGLTDAQWREISETAEACGPEVGKAYVNRGVFDLMTYGLFDTPEATGNPVIVTYAVRKPKFDALRDVVGKYVGSSEQSAERVQVDPKLEQVIKEVQVVWMISSLLHSGQRKVDIVMP